MKGNMRYKIDPPLDACTDEEIDKAFEYLDEWKANTLAPFTLKMFYEVFPQFSGGEARAIHFAWSEQTKVRYRDYIND